jgi:hypothetical protein
MVQKVLEIKPDKADSSLMYVVALVDAAGTN